MKKTFTFTQVLFAAFLCLVILVIASALTMEAFIFNSTFGQYLEEQTISDNLDWVSFIEDSFQAGTDPSFDLQRAAMMNQLEFTFFDESGSQLAIIDSSTMGMGHMQRSYGTMAEKEYPLKSGPFASVRIGRPESSILSIPEANFRKNLNRGYLFVGFLSMIMAGVIAFLLSRRVSKPIRNLESYANSIAIEDWKETPPPLSKLYEVDSLRTSLKELQARLQAQSRLRQQLTTNISHELRTPLNVLLNQFEAIQDGLLPMTPERNASLIQEIHRLTRLVEQIEKLNDLKVQVDLLPQSFDLSIVLKDMADSYRSLFENRRISFTAKIPEQIEMVSQEDALRQILFNLLENALRYTEDGGQVSLEANLEDNRIKIHLKDTGIGIPDDALPHIFDRFYRVDKARAKETGGSGLGLSIVKELTTLLQGTISCRSEVGKGSHFALEFPTSPLH